MSKLLYDDNFKHVSYHTTNVAKTFARIRKQQAEEAAKRDAEAEAVELEAARKVRKIGK